MMMVGLGITDCVSTIAVQAWGGHTLGVHLWGLGNGLASMLGGGLSLADAGASPVESHIGTGPPPSAAWPAILWIVHFGIAAIVGAIGLCLFRILRGPHLADRVLSADVISLLLVALVILLMIETDNSVFLDTALVVAIIGFASTVAFAQYIGARPGDGDQERSKPPAQQPSDAASWQSADH